MSNPVTCLALDFGFTISARSIDHTIGQKPVDPAAAEAPPEQALFVGDNLECDVVAALAHGMRAAFVRPNGLRPGETLPNNALLIRHVRDVPALLYTIRDQPWPQS